MCNSEFVQCAVTTNHNLFTYLLIVNVFQFLYPQDLKMSFVSNKSTPHKSVLSLKKLLFLDSQYLYIYNTKQSCYCLLFSKFHKQRNTNLASYPQLSQKNTISTCVLMNICVSVKLFQNIFWNCVIKFNYLIFWKMFKEDNIMF